MGSVLCLFGLVTVHEHTHNCTHIHSCAHGDCTKVVFVNQFCYDMIQKHFFVCLFSCRYCYRCFYQSYL